MPPWKKWLKNANNLLPILRPLISPNNTINANPNNNSLVITDYGDNLRRLEKIVAAMDMPNATDIEVIPLKHAIAGDLAPLVLRLLDAGGGAPAGGGADGSFKTTLIPEPRSNALILRAANPTRLALARSLVAKLDQPPSENASGNIYVVYLKNADATKLAVTLRAARRPHRQHRTHPIGCARRNSARTRHRNDSTWRRTLSTLRPRPRRVRACPQISSSSR